DAQYWLGDCYYNQKQHNQAIGAFEQLLINYPKSNKTPAALLRSAFARLAVNDTKNARLYLERVIAEYPAAEEGSLARMRLETVPKSK
ncbi:MAG: tetratricopeptide repeat protein, partial [candidate division Zixibacteria bacterium]|nr:tetratricopeptide repeat protein [candidate division Zixibacteria bacterium]